MTNHLRHKQAQKAQDGSRYTLAVFAPFVPFAGRIALEISLTHVVSAIAIQLDCLAGAFAGSATVFPVGLRRACARWVFAFFFVSHNSLLTFCCKQIE